MKQAIHLVIHGRVQGVCFRAYAVNVAAELEVTGYVRNSPDGTVELLAEGETDRLQELIQRCHQGPAGAQVARLDFQWKPATDRHHNFRIAY